MASCNLLSLLFAKQVEQFRVWLITSTVTFDLCSLNSVFTCCLASLFSVLITDQTSVLPLAGNFVVLALDLEGVHDVKLHHPSSSVATSNQ